MGGALNFIRDLSVELVRRGYRVDIALDNRYRSKFNVTGPNILWFDSMAITAYSPSITLLKILQQTDADVIHINGYRSFQCDFTSLASVFRGIPLVLTPHGSLLGYKHLSKSRFEHIPYLLHDIMTLKIPTRLCRFVIATSDAEFRDIVDFGVRSEKIKIIPLPFEPKNFSSEKTKPLGNTKKLLFVGRIVPNKNLDLLIRSFALVLKKFPDVELNLVGEEITGKLIGDSGYKAKLAKVIAELGIKHKVKFLGWQENEKLWSIYSESYLLVCLSTYENFCLPILEAASFGLPIISTDVGVAKDVIGNNEGGRIVLPEPKSITDAILDFLKDNTKYSIASKFLLSHAKDFDVGPIANKYEEIFHLAKDD